LQRPVALKVFHTTGHHETFAREGRVAGLPHYEPVTG
jgi:hypothetical protein